MDWFTEVFIRSLDERLNEKASETIWVSEKQANILRKHMKASECFDFFYIVIGEYQYRLDVFKKGYGRLTREPKMVAYH